MAGEGKPIETEIVENGDYLLSNGPKGESRIIVYRDFLSKEEADAAYDKCLEVIPFEEFENTREDTGETLVEPRKIAWFGDYAYTYEKITHPANTEWPETLQNMKERIEKKIDHKFNSVLGNLYRDEADVIPWHSDSDSEFGINPSIASISLGETRRFGLRKIPPEGSKGDFSNMPVFWVPLPHGCLVVMKGAIQEDWQHSIPPETRKCKPRINLTFRRIYAPEDRPKK